MGRKTVEHGKATLPRDCLLRGGKITFRKRWPADLCRRHPELKNKPFQRALGTSDPEVARPLAEDAHRAFRRECEKYRTPTPQDQVQEWLGRLSGDEQQQLLAYVVQQFGRERRLDLPADAPTEVYNDKHQGPNWYVPVPEQASEVQATNPFLVGGWTWPEADVPSTPERSTERLLRDIEAGAKALARPVVEDPRRRSRDWEDKRVIAEKLEASLSALKRLGFPTSALPKSAAAAATELESAAGKALSAETLLKAWASESRPAPATLKKYAGAFRQVGRVLGIEDVRKLTKADVVRFKEARLAEGRDPGTVADEMIAAGTICKWAVANAKLADNPFAGLAPKATKRGPKSRTPYSDQEAATILQAARKEAGWRRWLPWLLAFSGARLSEVADMRRGDVRQDSGVWVLDFVPLLGRAGKNEIFQRMVPLHPAVIAEGFLDYLVSLRPDPSSPLFPDLTAGKDGSRTVAATSAHGRWVRDVAGITGADKAPAHSWRHRMEDELRKVRALPEVVDAITGRYNPRNAGAGYGVGFRGMPDETLKELGKVPSPLV